MSSFSDLSVFAPLWDNQETLSHDRLVLLKSSSTPHFNTCTTKNQSVTAEEIWRSLQQKNYDFMQPILKDMLDKKATRPYQINFKKELSRFPSDALPKSMDAIYRKCIHPNDLSDEHRDIGKQINHFFSAHFNKKGTVTFQSENKEIRYNAHEIKNWLDYSIFAGVPPFKRQCNEKHFHDFLKDKNIVQIIDLTNTSDHIRAEKECNDSYKYWNSVHEYVKEESVFEMMQEAPELSKIDLKGRDIWRFNFNWKDAKGVNTEELYAFIEGLSKCVTKGNRFVHCLAGLGRTGTFTICSQLFEASKNRCHAFWVDYTKTICELIVDARTKRGPGFVQTEEQLFTICEFANILLDNEDKFFVEW